MASFVLEIYVNNISTVAQLYNTIKVYRSITGLSQDRAYLDSFALVAGQSSYSYIDSDGDDSYAAWFTYYNSNTGAESAYSEAVEYGAIRPGYAPVPAFTGATYPDEYELSYSETSIVDNIRLYIGDKKRVKRDYVNSSNESLYGNVSNDGSTYSLSEPPGWPLRVVLDSVEYITTDNPEVREYEYLTFSGTTISTTSGTLDVWYNHFRHSDRQLLRNYYDTPYPSPLSESNITTEIREVATSIAILESELRELLGSLDGSFTIAGDTRLDPSPVIRGRENDLKTLRDKLKSLIDEVTYTGLYSITGIRIE